MILNKDIEQLYQIFELPGKGISSSYKLMIFLFLIVALVPQRKFFIRARNGSTRSFDKDGRDHGSSCL